MNPAPITGLLFDMDGTLVNTENETGRSITEVLGQAGLPVIELHPSQTAGKTWQSICEVLIQRNPQVADIEDLEGKLVQSWLGLVRGTCEPIPGAPAFLRQALQGFPVAIVSSSPRFVMQELLAAIGVPEASQRMIGAEDVTHSKPHPEAFLKGAAVLDCLPERCLVFEDSTAGLMSAKAAGCGRMAILHASGEPEACRELAEASTPDYLALAQDFLQQLNSRGRSAYR